MKHIVFTLLIILFLGACVQNQQSENKAQKTIVEFPSEKIFYKMSDINTTVTRLTTDPSEDMIFYQEPNGFSPDSKHFLFQSSRRDGQYRLYVINIESGNITQITDRTSFGWTPTWAHDSKHVYVGQKGQILKINIQTGKEQSINIPSEGWVTFLYRNPSGDRIVFVEEGSNYHNQLATIRTDGTDYRVIHALDHQEEFFLDHPLFATENTIIYLTRGSNRTTEGDFNKPFVATLNGSSYRISIDCSHYDIRPQGDLLLCGQEGYIIDLQGNVVKRIPEMHGHGAWAPDGEQFLMTGDPAAIPTDSSYQGKIILINFSANYSTNQITTVVSHESIYDSFDAHIQPNAHFSPDGKYIIYTSERGQRKNQDLYLVEINKREVDALNQN